MTLKSKYWMDSCLKLSTLRSTVPVWLYQLYSHLLLLYCLNSGNVLNV